jgi:hypothetical protein
MVGAQRIEDQQDDIRRFGLIGRPTLDRQYGLGRGEENQQGERRHHAGN